MTRTASARLRIIRDKICRRRGDFSSLSALARAMRLSRSVIYRIMSKQTKGIPSQRFYESLAHDLDTLPGDTERRLLYGEPQQPPRKGAE